MTEHSRRWISLRLQFIATLLAAVMVGFLVALAVRTMGVWAVERWYYTPELAEQRSVALLDGFEDYVREKHLSIGDKDKIAAWVRERRYCFLVVSRGEEELLSLGWVGNEAHYSAIQRALSQQQDEVDGVACRLILFVDGGYQVWLSDFSEQPLLRLARVMGYVVGTLLPVLMMVFYYRSVIRRILKLGREVEEVAMGNLHGPISFAGEDEIGDLSRNVSAMRDTVMEKMQAEREAWQANSELITRMGHDIRTPLTVLVGFLELLEEGRFSDNEIYERYLTICRNNAFQLKELAEELFQYFLVFGHRSYELKPEVVNAKTLMSQLIGEHVLLLREQGWQLKLNPMKGEESLAARLRADPVYLKRLFDNLFSNVEKYADSRRPVYVSLWLEQGQIHVWMKNDIRPEPSPAVSTGIGLKTCERIAELMGGSFRVHREKQTFQMDLYLPVWNETGNSE